MMPSFRFFPVLLLFFLPLAMSAQDLKPVPAHVQELHLQGADFVSRDIFSPAIGPKIDQDNKLGQNSKFLRLDEEKLHRLVGERPEAISLNLPWQGDTLRLELYQAPVLTDGFSVRTSAHEPFYYAPGAYYRGIIAGEPESLVAVSFFEGEVIGVVSHPLWGNLNLGRLDIPGNRLDYVLYSDLDLPENLGFECAYRETGEKPDIKVPQQQKVSVSGCVRVFFECDYELFQNKGSVANTVNYVTGFYNVVSTIYTNETISTKISQIYVWTVPDNYSTVSSGAALDDFVAYRTSFDGDLAHLVGLGGGGLGGIAYLDVLCSGFNYAFSNISSSYQAYPTYSWTINVVTHEMGHNIASPHTHWCGWVGGAIDDCGPTAGYPTEGGCDPGPTPTNGGTIMSYCHLLGIGINFANGFGPQPGDAIRNAVTSAGCLSASCPSPSCTAPTALTVTGITNASAIIGWNSIGGASAYNLQYRVSGSFSWTTIGGVSSPYTLTGLSPSTLYEVQIQAVCGANSSPYATGVIFETGTSPCPEPDGLVAGNATAMSIDLDWTENGNATQWEIQYGAPGFTLGAGTIVSVSNKPYTLLGLNPATTYAWYVRANCGGALGNSGWVGPSSFTTILENDEPSGAIELTVDQPCPGVNAFTNTGATTFPGEFNPTTGNGGYWNTGISNTVWFKFTAPSSGSVKITSDISPLGTLNDTQIALYNSDNPTNVTQLLVANEDGGTLGSGFAAVAYYSGLTPGAVYYIQVDGWSASTGTFCIEVYESFSLPNPGTSCPSYTQTLVNGAAAPNKWFNIYTKPNNFNIGLPVAAVRSSANLGTVTVKANRYTSVQTAPNGVKYMQRYYTFSSSLNQGGAKDVRLFYTDAELNSLKVAVNLPGNTAEDLNISHYDGTVEDCTPNNNNANGTTLITDVTATDIGGSGIFYLEYQSPGFSEMGAVFGLVALPVELLSFTGSAEQDRNTLRWVTASEKDVDYFSIERSPDGQGQWREIGRAAPQTTQAPEKHYALDDVQPFARSFYRLKTNDLDGSASYSGIVLLERAVDEGLLTLYPNPAGEMLYAEYQAAREMPLVCRIIGADGQLILEVAAELGDGLNILPFQIGDLPAGLYYFSVSGGAGMPFVKR